MIKTNKKTDPVGGFKIGLPGTLKIISRKTDMIKATIPPRTPAIKLKNFSVAPFKFQNLKIEFGF